MRAARSRSRIGTHTADITLLGHYVAADFHVQSDNHGGAEIVTDPPAKAETDLQIPAPSRTRTRLSLLEARWLRSSATLVARQ